MATVTEQVGEVLLGTTEEPQLSQLMRQTFLRFATKGDDDEYYLSETEFIDAIAPESEDYVSLSPQRVGFRELTTRYTSAQNQALPIWHFVCRRRPRCQRPHQHAGLGCLPESAR
jgi:hypothetical protein